MLFPAIPTAVQAEEGNTTTTLSVEPAIAISLPNTIAFDLTPSADGVFASSTASLAVSTNNETGYSLYFSTTNTDNSLHSQNPATTETIAAVSGSTTEENFENNTWGYNLSLASAGDATTYEAVPTSSETALLTTEAPSNDNYNLTFGAKVSTAMPSGTYTNTVAVSVVANPAIITSLTQLTYMQDMTPEICASSTENDTTRLTDIRDGKQYWVAKLPDNNCWMTQNLDLDLTNGTPLTPNDSDVSSSWNPPRSTEKNGTVTGDSTNTETYSWDFGLYVKNNPDNYESYCNQVKTMSGCEGWTDATNLTPAETEWTGSVDNTVSGNTYDAHFLIGNFYQWNAATAGTGGTITSQEAIDSICPKGWRLPTSNNSNSGSFGGLVGSLNSTTITQAPYYFNPSGNVNSGSLWVAGYGGSYRSSTAVSSTSGAYSLYFSSGYVNPSSNDPRSNGQSVRCLAR